MITIAIIIVTVIASYAAWNDSAAFEKYTFKPYAVVKYKEYFRFISSGFLHLDGNHLFFNMLTLYFFGPSLEAAFRANSGSNGWLFYLGLYITALVVSEVGTFQKHLNNSRYSSLGASGAVSAVVFAGIWMYPQMTIWGFIPGFVYGAIYLIYTAHVSKNDYSGTINHDAHFYGSVWGILYCLLFYPSSLSDFLNYLVNFRMFDFF